MTEPLLPNEVRELYEDLLEGGTRFLGDAEAHPADLNVLLERGLAITLDRDPPLLLPAVPEAAFARLMMHWQAGADDDAQRLTAILRMSSRLQRLSLISARAHDSQRSCAIVWGKAQVAALQTVLSTSASTRVRACHAGLYGEPAFLPSGEPHLLRTSYIKPPPEYRRRDGHTQILASGDAKRMLEADFVKGYKDGEEIRVIESVALTKLLLVDDHTVLLALGPYGHPCVLIRNPLLVRFFEVYFSVFWASALPWTPDGSQTAGEDTSLRQRVLESLASGMKDEAIARHLGMSARTVRRHVAALMQDLGASTRFAAGVAAVRQGLVTEEPHRDGPRVLAPPLVGIDR